MLIFASIAKTAKTRVLLTSVLAFLFLLWHLFAADAAIERVRIGVLGMG